MKVAVVGANGQLGADVVEAFQSNGDAVLPLTHNDIRVEDRDTVVGALKDSGAELVVNTSAMHHVEWCEKIPGKAFAVNAVGAKNLAEATAGIGAALVHVSTDYVFDGLKDRPYDEDDTARPLNVYGASKLAGEHLARYNPRHFVLRTSALYGRRPCRRRAG